MEMHERNPTEWNHLNLATDCLLALGNLGEVEAMAKKAVKLSEKNAGPLSTLAQIHVALGNREEAEAIREELIEKSARVYVPPLSVAMVRASLGYWDSAFESLQTAIDKRELVSGIFMLRTPCARPFCGSASLLGNRGSSEAPRPADRTSLP